MKRYIKHTLWTLAALVVASCCLMAVCNHLVTSGAQDHIITLEQIKQGQFTPGDSTVAVLLGTAPQSRVTGKRNLFYNYRIDAAVELYNSGAVSRILISGDEHSLYGVNEVVSMRDTLVTRGIPAQAIVLDGKGFRTINSVRNAHDKFGVKRAIFVSQRFHNERAIYLAQHLHIPYDDIRAYNARDPRGIIAMRTYLREYPARVKMFLDLYRQ